MRRGRWRSGCRRSSTPLWSISCLNLNNGIISGYPAIFIPGFRPDFEYGIWGGRISCIRSEICTRTDIWYRWHINFSQNSYPAKHISCPFLKYCFPWFLCLRLKSTSSLIINIFLNLNQNNDPPSYSQRSLKTTVIVLKINPFTPCVFVACSYRLTVDAGWYRSWFEGSMCVVAGVHLHVGTRELHSRGAIQCTPVRGSIRYVQDGS